MMVFLLSYHIYFPLHPLAFSFGQRPHVEKRNLKKKKETFSDWKSFISMTSAYSLNLDINLERYVIYTQCSGSVSLKVLIII